MGVTDCFRSLCIPLGISVELYSLEIAGLDLGFGLVMGDFGLGILPSTTLVS